MSAPDSRFPRGGRPAESLTPLVLLGAGDHAEDVVSIAAACAAAGRFAYDILGCLVDPEYGSPGTVVCDLPVLGAPSWLEGCAADIQVFCAVGSAPLRRRFTTLCSRYGRRSATIVHPSAIIGPDVSLGEGVMIAAGCVLSRNIRIGPHTHINIGCMVPHGATLSDHVTLSPGVQLAGNVTIESGCFVGMGASVIERRRLGAWSTIGAGTVVIRDVPANATVVGVPGRIIKTKAMGWHETRGE